MSDDYYKDGVHDPGRGYGKAKKERSKLPALVLALSVAFFLGGGFGAAVKPEPDLNFHTYAEQLATTKHCVPLLDWAVGTERGMAEAGRDSSVIFLTEAGMKNVEGSVVSVQIGGKTYYIGIVTWENCAE